MASHQRCRYLATKYRPRCRWSGAATRRPRAPHAGTVRTPCSGRARCSSSPSRPVVRRRVDRCGFIGILTPIEPSRGASQDVEVLVQYVAIGRVHQLSAHTALSSIRSSGGHRYSPRWRPTPRGRAGGSNGRESDGRRAVPGLLPPLRPLFLIDPAVRGLTYIGLRD